MLQKTDLAMCSDAETNVTLLHMSPSIKIFTIYSAQYPNSIMQNEAGLSYSWSVKTEQTKCFDEKKLHH
jgi:hypothetical protein